MNTRQMPGKSPSRIISHGGQGSGGFRPDGPPAGEVRLHKGDILQRGRLGGLVVMEKGSRAVPNRHRAVPAVFQRKLHVALPAGQPDLSDIDGSSDHDLPLTGNRQGPGPSRREGGQIHPPGPVFRRRCRGGNTSQRNGDALPRRRSSPDGDRFLPLEDAAVGKNSRQSQNAHGLIWRRFRSISSQRCFTQSALRPGSLGVWSA